MPERMVMKGREVKTAKRILDEMVGSVSEEEWNDIQHFYNTSVDYHCLPDQLDTEIPRLQSQALAALTLRRE